MSRQQTVQQILEAKRRLNLSWMDIAKRVGRSEVWTTAACLGQTTCSPEEVLRLAETLEMEPDDMAVLTAVPYRGTHAEMPPRDPTIYRLYEIILVYGETIKELIYEKFGDGIMSAIDFQMSVQRIEDPAGDRVEIVMNGKFLPYKKW
ncbi:MAG: cyanase [Sulfobacillus thermosulfidooxidans]|nr:MAG: cyanase [Sulfobacillus thermosulfidooxidans]